MQKLPFVTARVADTLELTETASKELNDLLNDHLDNELLVLPECGSLNWKAFASLSEINKESGGAVARLAIKRAAAQALDWWHDSRKAANFDWATPDIARTLNFLCDLLLTESAADVTITTATTSTTATTTKITPTVLKTTTATVIKNIPTEATPSTRTASASGAIPATTTAPTSKVASTRTATTTTARTTTAQTKVTSSSTTTSRSSCKTFTGHATVALTTVPLIERQLFMLAGITESTAQSQSNTDDSNSSSTGLLKDILLEDRAHMQRLPPGCTIALGALLLPLNGGLNLRNLVWHGFLCPIDINPAYSALLLSCFVALHRVTPPASHAFRSLCGAAIAARVPRWPNTDRFVSIAQGLLALPDNQRPWTNPRGDFLDVRRVESFKAAVAFLKLSKGGGEGGNEIGIESEHNGCVLFMQLVLPLVLEHGLRTVFAKVNEGCEHVCLADQGEYFATLDGYGQRDIHHVMLNPAMMGQPDSHNMLFDQLGRGLSQFLLDLFLFRDGPALRSLLAHGHWTLKFQQPSKEVEYRPHVEDVYDNDDNNNSRNNNNNNNNSNDTRPIEYAHILLVLIAAMCEMAPPPCHELQFTTQTRPQAVQDAVAIVNTWELAFHPLSIYQRVAREASDSYGRLDHLAVARSGLSVHIDRSKCVVIPSDSKGDLVVDIGGSAEKRVDEIQRLSVPLVDSLKLSHDVVKSWADDFYGDTYIGIAADVDATDHVVEADFPAPAAIHGIDAPVCVSVDNTGGGSATVASAHANISGDTTNITRAHFGQSVSVDNAAPVNYRELVTAYRTIVRLCDGVVDEVEELELSVTQRTASSSKRKHLMRLVAALPALTMAIRIMCLCTGTNLYAPLVALPQNAQNGADVEDGSQFTNLDGNGSMLKTKLTPAVRVELLSSASSSDLTQTPVQPKARNASAGIPKQLGCNQDRKMLASAEERLESDRKQSARGTKPLEGSRVAMTFRSKMLLALETLSANVLGDGGASGAVQPRVVSKDGQSRKNKDKRNKPGAKGNIFKEIQTFALTTTRLVRRLSLQ